VIIIAIIESQSSELFHSTSFFSKKEGLASRSGAYQPTAALNTPIGGSSTILSTQSCAHLHFNSPSSRCSPSLPLRFLQSDSAEKNRTFYHRLTGSETQADK